MSVVFLKAPKDVFYCSGIVSPQGEKIPLSCFDKMIYFHMLDRKKLFTERGQKHFESQDNIAELLHLDRKTVNRSMKKLLEAGLVFGRKERHPLRGYQHWVYTGVNEFPVVYGSDVHPRQSVIEDDDPPPF